MSTRRDALRLFAIVPAAIPAAAAVQQTRELGDQPGHLHTGPTLQTPTPSKPTFFQPAELQVVEALSERIIPRTDTPGAKDAGVALLIDKAIFASPLLGPTYRAGIADLNTKAQGSYGKEFVALSEEQQVELLTPLSLENESPLGQFFTLVKDMTVEAYYKTEAGLKTELGWHGNTYLASFPGCDHTGHQA